jgi:hypothetical protein
VLLVGGGGPWHVPEEERVMLPISEALDALESDIRKAQRANTQVGLQLAELLRDVQAVRATYWASAVAPQAPDPRSLANISVREAPLPEGTAAVVSGNAVTVIRDLAPACVHQDRNAVTCNGPAAFLVNYYQGAGAHKLLADVVSPLCYAHATYEAGSFGRQADAYHSAEWGVIPRMRGDTVEKLASGVERHTYHLHEPITAPPTSKSPTGPIGGPTP